MILFHWDKLEPIVYTATILPYIDKRKQVTNHQILCYSCFPTDLDIFYFQF